MKTILVTGANGQVGSELKELAKDFSQYKFLFTGRNELDINDLAAVKDFFDCNVIDYCINCAAYTAVDKAESDWERAYLINAKAVSYLAQACQRNNSVLVHFSTDYVYHGSHNRPLKESNEIFPKSAYAYTKLLGDQMALGTNERTIILRTSWVYSRFGHNFVKTMLRLGASRDSLNVVFDQIGTPTNAEDLAEAVLSLLPQLHKKEKFGIYHYSNEGVTSWYDFAAAIFDINKIECQISPIESKDYPTPAARPTFSVLDKGKIKATFGLKIPHWRKSLVKCLSKIEK